MTAFGFFVDTGRRGAVQDTQEDTMAPKYQTLARVFGLVVVAASVAVSTATATPTGPGTTFYTAQALKADGLRWEALADHYAQLESRPAASFYTPRALTAQGLRWQAMARVYRTRTAPVVTISRSSGFDWEAALIGAAGSFGLATCATALVLASRRRRAKLAHS